MSIDNYVTHLNISYDIEKLKKESIYADFLPFQLSTPKNCVFDYMKDWKMYVIEPSNFKEFKEVERLYNIIMKITKCKIIRPRFMKQTANFEVPLHHDQGNKCAFNFILSDNKAPITFEDIGEVNYKNALINTSAKHSVKAYPHERLLLKFSIIDMNYNQCRKAIINSGLQQ